MGQAPPVIGELIARFERNLESYRSQGYNETQLRREFLDPFFDAVGWDVANKSGKTFQEEFNLDFEHFRGMVTIGEPPIYKIANMLEKIQRDWDHVVSGFKRLKVEVWDQADLEKEREEYEKGREEFLIQREVPGCEAGGVSRVLRSRTSPARNQLRATPVKAWESTAARKETRSFSKCRSITPYTTSTG